MDSIGKKPHNKMNGEQFDDTATYSPFIVFLFTV